MWPFRIVLIVAPLFLRAAIAEVLTIVTPCSTAAYPPSPITVTSQFQKVSTCRPATSCTSGTCLTSDRYITFDYVASTIPCEYDESTHTECVVTKTDQAVTISKSSSTSTITTTSHAVFEKWPGGHGMHNDTKKTHEVLMKTWVASFLNIGPLAMPGYGGSGLCAGCGPDDGGSRSQTFNVTECWTGPFRNSSCSEYMEIWISMPVPSETSSISAIVSTTSYVASQGTYTFAFTQQAPAVTVLAPASTVTVTLLDGETSQIVEASRTITVPGTPWTAVVTSTCQGPTFFDFVTTVTTTATWIAPYETGTSTMSSVTIYNQSNKAARIVIHKPPNNTITDIPDTFNE
ncbi:hypothetical protein LTR10_018199 [Elasticomyces elasticus]|uniref:Uncharacterized protein n=1 Tax=Exophiala sideris TaxID=1016849 RepID=A0ABR0J387_9EURO|nr:hypothetical protein LTR10_018199 [Elasticomyces elasticus]KAK5024920.1 hypothetical protein LTS07_008298 [Exophiala sideris]KAK5031491.1 hypothetical protein LTR13_007819 [Exophiala sideris]KAK5054959.1 hypothetical protein LTR69_008527 [Exophiala sideris]KAK5179839.1 hypothetical protein LTR44_007655 [Eurotiomycetes sp. CCFEE 6388]